uniref:Radial spoke head protein 9 homolog n=1 Tax=Oncorhynchus mykiss TaxID=8022 RepID=A0A8K9XD72_ONCMY
MESKTLFYSLGLVSGNGLTLSSEQKAALQTSLVNLRNYLYILGIQGDYFIAQGVSDDEMSHKNSLFIFNCAMLAEVSSAAKGRYVGDSSHKYEHTETRGGGRGYGGGRHGEEKYVTNYVIKVNEENRLPTTVHTIDKEVSVVLPPLRVSMVWCLSSSEMDQLRCFLHFTEPKNLKKKSILDLDIPKGCGSSSLSTAVLCVISSMLWLCLTTFEEPLTP